MTYLEKVAAHKQELRDKQTELKSRLDELFRAYDFGNVKITSHLNRMLNTTQYRKRDVAAINRMLTDNNYLSTQFIAFDSYGTIMNYNEIAAGLDIAAERIANSEAAGYEAVDETSTILSNFEAVLNRYVSGEFTQEEFERFATTDKKGRKQLGKLKYVTIPKNRSKILDLQAVYRQQLAAIGEKAMAIRLSSAGDSIIDSIAAAMFAYYDEDAGVAYNSIYEIITGGAADLGTAMAIGDMEYDDGYGEW